MPADVPPGTRFPSPEVVVVLSLDVSAEGKVEKASVESGAGEPFDSAALSAARRFDFEPGRLTTGEAVPVTVTFRLRIQEPAAPPPAPVKLTGYLLERGSRLPIPNVPVAALAGEEVVARATTDGSGRFQIEVPAGRVPAGGLPPGRQKLDLLVKAQAGEIREENYLLESLGGPNETVVSASAIQREVMKDVLTAEQVFTVPGSAGDTLKAVLNLPGAARAPFGAGLLVLRGSAPGDSKVFLESQQIPQLYHFGGIRSTYAPAFLQSVEFVPGNFSVDYGRAQGGIIDVRVRDPRQDGFHGQADVNLYDVGVEMEGGLGGGWSLGGAARRSWIDTILPLFLPKDANLSFSTAPRFYDFQFIASWNPDASQKLRIIFYGSMDRLVALFDKPMRDPTITGQLDARVSFYNLQAEYSKTFSERLRQDTSVVIGLQEIRTQIGPQYFFDLNVRRLSLRSTWAYDFSSQWNLRAGIDAEMGRAAIGVNLPNSTGAEPAASLVAAPDRRPAHHHVLLAGALRRAALGPHPEPLHPPGRSRQLVLGHQPVGRRPAPAGPLGGGSRNGDPRCGRPVPAGAQPAEDQRGHGQPLPPARAEPADQRRGGAEVHGGDLPRRDRLLQGAHPAGHPQLRLELRSRTPRATPAPAPGPSTGWRPCSRWPSATASPAGSPTPSSGRCAPTRPTLQRPYDFDQPNNLTVLGTYQLGRGWSAGARFRLVSGNPYTPVVGLGLRLGHRGLRPGLRRDQQRPAGHASGPSTCASTRSGPSRTGRSPSTSTPRT